LLSSLSRYKTNSPTFSIDPVRQRQEILAKERLQHVKDKTYSPPDVTDNFQHDAASLLDLQLAAIRQMTLKHQQEQEVGFTFH